MTRELRLLGLDGVPEVTEGDDLVGLLLRALADAGEALAPGDVVAVTSKVVSKAEGATWASDRASAITADTVEVVARRGETRIVRTVHGLVLAAAGVDASNVAPGTVLRLPVDPDASARRLRAGIARRTGTDVGVVVTDTAGRPWRQGQTDIAVGCAGLVALDDHAGRRDGHGNELAVTAPAVADEVAGAAELATGKTGGRPFTVVRGLADLVRADDGPGARSLVRPRELDMFALGTRESVVAACSPDAVDVFGRPVEALELVAALADLHEPADVGTEVTRHSEDLLVRMETAEATGAAMRLGVLVSDTLRLARAHGWAGALADERAGGGRYAVALRLHPRPGAPAPRLEPVP